MNILSWGEVFTAELTGQNAVTITSKCRGIQVFDWGKNRQNVDQFLSYFAQHATHAARLGQQTPAYLDDPGRSPVEKMIRD